MNKQKNTIDNSRILMHWETAEFIPMKRSKLWYVVASLIYAGLLIYAISTGSITMAIAFTVLAIVYAIVDRRKPYRVDAAVTDMGVFYDGNFYPYNHISAFFVVYHPPHVNALYLKVRSGRNMKNVRIELLDNNPNDVRQVLLNEVPELEGAHEPIFDTLTRVLRIH